MIVLPLLAVAIGIGLFRLAAATKHEMTSVGGAIRVQHQPRKYRTILARRIKTGKPVTRWLVSAAAAEACEAGDAKTLYYLSHHFSKVIPSKTVPHTPSSTESVETSESTEPFEGENEPTLKSPIDNVGDEEWADFMSRLRTKEPGFSTDRYVGQYEQNRTRLKQLGIAEPKTPDEEHEVLAKDMAAHAKSSAALINQWSGDVLTINGIEHPICASGILGLLKSAGAEGAESWLTREEDRIQYPKTTEAFLRSNGCF